MVNLEFWYGQKASTDFNKWYVYLGLADNNCDEMQRNGPSKKKKFWEAGRFQINNFYNKSEKWFKIQKFDESSHWFDKSHIQ